MSLKRGKYGLEWNPRQDEPKSSGLGWIVLVVGLVAIVSFSVTWARRYRAAAQEDSEAAGEMSPVAPPSAPSGTPARPVEPLPPAVPPVGRDEVERRPPRVRNLLLRLEEAERRRDVEMAVSTIEQIRALPGSPAADLDDALARRLGTLNMRRLFERKTPLWVRQVEVRRGDSASRIAAENGSTFASFARLNGGDVGTVRLGAKVYVMAHPRFTLVVHRRTWTADLLLKEKFFKRYDLVKPPTGKAGAYELPRAASAFWKSLGIAFGASDQTELELLMPVGSSVLVSEM